MPRQRNDGPKRINTNLEPIPLDTSVSGLTHWTEGTDPSAMTDQSGSPLLRMRSPEQFDLLDNLGMDGVGGGCGGQEACGESASKSSSRGSKLDTWLSKGNLMSGKSKRDDKAAASSKSKKSNAVDEYTSFDDNSCVERNVDRNWFWDPPPTTTAEADDAPGASSSSSETQDWRKTASANLTRLADAVLGECHVLGEYDYDEITDLCSQKMRSAIRISRVHCAAHCNNPS